MEINKGIIELISRIEYLIGSKCFNKNAFNNKKDKSNKWFRYPVHYMDRKVEVCVKEPFLQPKDNSIETINYKFGSNDLYIGLGIIDTLEFLEQRYGLDFNELEKKYQKNRLKNKKEISASIKKEGDIEVDAGIYEVGKDIDPGSYIFESDDDICIDVYRKKGSRYKSGKYMLSENKNIALGFDEGDLFIINGLVLLKK